MIHEPDWEASNERMQKNRKKSQVARGRWRQWKALKAKPAPGFHKAQQLQAAACLPFPAF